MCEYEDALAKIKRIIDMAYHDSDPDVWDDPRNAIVAKDLAIDEIQEVLETVGYG